MDYQVYTEEFKSKLMNFDFEDCPPVQQLVIADRINARTIATT